jgi:hypothetical protein
MVRTFLKVYMELGSYFLFLQEQIKDIIIMCVFIAALPIAKLFARETRVSGFLTPSSVLFSTPESRVGPALVWNRRMWGLHLSKSECEHAARRLAGKTRSLPTFRAIALASSSTMAQAVHPISSIKGLIGTPCVARRGRKPREKMKIGQTLRSGSFEFDLHEKKPWLVPHTD